MEPFTNDEFFAKLSELFASRKGKSHGAVHLIQKRLAYDAETPAKTTDFPLPAQPSQPLPILIRVRNNKGKEERTEKIKLSTLVQPGELDAFYGRYAEVCKTGMGLLKPRDRTKRKAKAKKKKAA
ncbi:signal recognition particle, SRP9/SRP14 subunit [Podospora aff. communis PSN243]|uniref:Signal recognition particle subunit SRP14 n=1 Tax=Podospora aff. communis PSN243 TaxID=3040156 RepID=A0AAV9GUV6_9PEZI|nr:signal recognition particle, SRP9/SRP14 subunit [Podospora aff. communis PSN243]